MDGGRFVESTTMSVYVQDTDFTLWHGDALDVLRGLPDASVHMCATSPPFYGLRDYGTGTWEGGDPECDHAVRKETKVASSTLGGGTKNSGHQQEGYGSTCGRCDARRVDQQIGLEATPDEWVARLVDVFREVRRVLRDDGTLWVEIGDSYSQGGNGPGAAGGITSTSNPGSQLPSKKAPPGYKPKDLLGQPWMLAKALRDPYYTGAIKSDADRVWLAAMIDAEGCIAIHKRPAGTPAYSSFEKKDGTTSDYVRKTDSYQPKVEITNTSRAIMERVVAIAGGNCETKQEAGTQGRKQTLYRWTVTADKARDLLREVYPYLVGKQHEARLAYGCPSSGGRSGEAHEALKSLHGGDTESVGIDFPAPESLWEAGWFLRSEIIWARLRPNPMPESVTDRPTKAHSTVFLLSKQPRYFYDADAIREAYSEPQGGRAVRRYPEGFKEDASGNGRSGRLQGPTNGQIGAPQAETLDGSNGEAPRGPDGRRATAVLGRDASEQHRDGDRWPNPSGANARSVWKIPTEPTPFAHFATWPQKLVERMILAGTSEHGCCPECGAPWERQVERTAMVIDRSERTHDKGRTRSSGTVIEHPTSTTVGWRPTCDHDLEPVPCMVLDPFGGSGTTALVSRRLGRRSVLIELSADYCALAAKRLSQQSLLVGNDA